MLLHIPAVVGRAELNSAAELLAAARFVDGRLSAGKAARRVKHNEELEPEPQLLERLNGLVMAPLVRHPSYQSAALPLRIASPFYARYTPGMSYGQHIDDPVMGAGERYRSDISITVFLNSPEDYDGGELLIRGAFGDTEVKLPAGDAVLYPSSSLHRVAEVTRGERLVAVTWVQSLVRDPARRELLHELNLAREHLMNEAPEADSTAHVDHAYVNLVRMWSEV